MCEQRKRRKDGASFSLHGERERDRESTLSLSLSLFLSLSLSLSLSSSLTLCLPPLSLCARNDEVNLVFVSK